jgi:uncharacterized protein (TIGR02284 family)
VYPSRRSRRIASAMQTVREILIDSQEGLVTVGERLQDPNLKRYFFALSLKRAQFIGELETILKQQGVTRIRDRGSAAAAVHRTWARIKSRFIHSDFTLLVTAEHGERAIAQVYDEVARTLLPLSMRRLLATQAKHIHMVHSFVKTARDRAFAQQQAAATVIPPAMPPAH